MNTNFAIMSNTKRAFLDGFNTGARYHNAMLNKPGRTDSFLNSKSNDELMLYVEASLALIYQFRNAKSKKCLVVASCSFYHAITGKSCVGSILRIFDQLAQDLASDLPFFQSDNYGWVDMCDDLHKNVHRVKDSKLGVKFIRVFNHLVAHAFYTKLGVEVDTELFDKLESKQIRPTVWNCIGFADAVVGLVLYLAKAGRQALLTRSIEAFFIDETVVTNWLDSAAVLRKDAEFISNPVVIGTSLPAYLAKLSDCIDIGRRLSQSFKNGKEHAIIHSVLLELELVKKRHDCSLMAAKFRRAPVGVFIYGEAGVAKSFISAGLFNHYASIRGVKDPYCWPRDDNDAFYSGYKSHFLGVLYDDAARVRSCKVQGVDETIKDIIRGINNIPFITNQAELHDKGKIPFLAEWCGVTSNVGDLNADHYFNSSAAFLRRLKVRIEPIVKAEYRIHGEKRIDTTKIPPGEQYPDLWEFEVAVPVTEGMNGYYKIIHRFQHYHQLLTYMTTFYEQHIAEQDKMMATVTKIGPEKLCDCRLPVSICRCVEEVCDKLVTSVVADHTPTAQADWMFGECPTEPGTLRVQAIMRLRLEGHKRLKIQKGPERLFYRCFWQQDGMDELMNITLEDKEPVAKTVDRIRANLDAAVKEFRALAPRERVDCLTDGLFGNDRDSDFEYLSFVPKPNGACFYLKEQLGGVRENVLYFVEDTLNDNELTLLDVFIYEHAPRMIAGGWSMKDIVRAAMDYVKYYSGTLDDPDILVTREYLLHDPSHTSFLQSVGLKCAQWYFEKPWFHGMCNYVSSFSLVRSTAAFTFSLITSDSPGDRLKKAARDFDARLMGQNKYVILFTSFAGLVVLVAAAYKLIKLFSKETGEAQLDLSLIGKKPVPRESEKVNHWHTEKRSITKLDVDPRRPQDSNQCVAAVRNNLCVVEIRGLHNGKEAITTTRMLVIDNENVLINNHVIDSLPCKLSFYVGPMTGEGVQPRCVIDVEPRMVTRIPYRDLCIIRTLALPRLFKNIRHLLPKSTFQSNGAATYLMKHKDGELEERACYGSKLVNMGMVQGADMVNCRSWAVTPERPTLSGDCGSVLMLDTPIGCVIAGIHFAYNEERALAYASPIYAEDFAFEEPMVTKGVLQPAGILAQSFVDLKPTDKLYTDYHESGNIITHGQLKGFIARPKFTGKKTPAADYVLSHGHEFDPPIEDHLGRPRATDWRAPQLILSKYLNPTHSMRECVIAACGEAMTDHIMANLTDEDKADIHPVPIGVAVNGFPAVPNIDAQKFTTSAGHGRRGPKLQFLSEPEEFEEWSSYREYDENVTAAVNKMVEDAMQGIRPHAIYEAVLKDEMLSWAKVLQGKARAIYMCPVDFLTAIRMFTLGICRVMVRRREIFGMAVGLNTHSEEWDNEKKRSDRIPGDNWMAGDFESFEAVLGLLLSNVANKVISDVSARCGNFDECRLLALKVFLADTVNPTINFFGTLITLLGGEASGHQLTTFFNCLCNQLLHMYAWVTIRLETEGEDTDSWLYDFAAEFFEFVYILTLGDDVMIKVHPDYPEYNHTSVQRVFRDIGITYTMADKTSVSRPYISLDEVTFLKRKFVDHVEFPGMKVAALDKKSVYKMLLYTVPSRSVTFEEQYASALCSAQAEAFFHGRDFYNQIWQLIENMPKTTELVHRMNESPRPTWNTMVQRFVECSPSLEARLVAYEPTVEQVVHSGALQGKWVDAWGSTNFEHPEEVRLSRQSALRVARRNRVRNKVARNRIRPLHHPERPVSVSPRGENHLESWPVTDQPALQEECGCVAWGQEDRPPGGVPSKSAFAQE